MRIIILAALFACAMGSVAPRWPRLPMDLILRNKLAAQQDEKIVGGTEVTPHSLPFQVVLERCSGTSCSLSCGGSVLTSSIILNAAHCVVGVSASSMRIVGGEHTLNKEEGTEQRIGVTSHKAHENYNRLTFENDISLIFLESPLTLNTNVQPVTLPTSGNTQTPTGKTLTVSGWGTTRSGGSISNVLLKVDVPVVSDADCEAAYGAGDILPSMLCAGDIRNGGIDSCQGDSGGPLFAVENGKHVQYGIVSWGQGCALPGYPGVYTEVSFFLKWISDNSA